MGGDYYDREVISTSNNNEVFSSISSSKIRGNDKLHKSVDPKRWSEEKLKSTTKNPIVFALDDTGSMGDWVYVIYDKLPMFYGQIMQQEYLEEPCISFCAIGDHNCCTAPLQVSEFGSGVELDQLISKLYLEGNGGGNEHESYELAAYFYLKQTELIDSEYPFFFVTGDEGYFEKLNKSTIKEFLDIEDKEDNNKYYDSHSLWQQLMNKYNVFHIKKPYIAKSYENKIIKQWEATLSSERVLVMEEPKAVIDIILGLIALTSSKRSLDEYLKDMENRNQSKDRVNLIRKLLMPYYLKLKSGQIKVIQNSNLSGNSKISNKTKKSNNDVNNINTVKTDQIQLVINNLHVNLKHEEIKRFKDLISLQTIMPDDIPKEYFCGLTGIIMINPVISCSGKYYEKSSFDFCVKNNLNVLEKEEIDGGYNEDNELKKLIDLFYNQNKNKI